MRDPKENWNYVEVYYPSAQEISSAILSRIGHELGDISLKDLLTYAVHEGIQFGADIGELGDDSIVETGDSSYTQTVEEAYPETDIELDRTVVPIARGKVIKEERARRQ